MGGTAVGLGRGTELYPLPDASPSPGIIVASGIHSSTPEAYAALKRPVLSEVSPAILREFQAFVVSSDGPMANSQPPINQFETVVFEQHPRLKSIKGKLLRLGARRALMTGSGSALFGLFSSRESRDRAAGWFRRQLPENQVYPFQMVSRGRYRALWWRQLAVSSENMTWPPQDRYAR